MERLTTGSKNLDLIVGGGIPGRTITVLGGPCGIGKSLLAHQILFSNVGEGERGIYMTTTSGSVNRLLRTFQPLAFFDEGKVSSAVLYEDAGELLVKEGLMKFIDLVAYNLKHAPVDYLVIDGFEAFAPLAPSPVTYQKFVYELLGLVGAYACTTILVGSYSWREFQESWETRAADQAIWMTWEENRPPHHRSLSVYKWTGGGVLPGRHTFAVGEQGVRAFPRFTPGKTTRKTDEAEWVPWGDPLLDRLLTGGVLAGSTTMLYGDAGTGKTLAGLRFIRRGIESGEPGGIVSFQEDQSELGASASFIGWDLKESGAKKALSLLYVPPIDVDFDELALKVAQVIREVGARRMFLNDISYLGRFGREDHAADWPRFFEFLYALQKFLKNVGVTSVWTYPALDTAHEEFLLGMVDNTVAFWLGREGRGGTRMSGSGGRWLQILKMRGKLFDSRIRSFDVTADGFLEGEALAMTPPVRKV